MRFKILVTSLAFVDVETAMEWYEKQKKGLGKDFYKQLTQKMKEVNKNPFHYQIRYRDIRQAFLDNFPYAINFKVDESKNEITVYAISHTSRDQNFWFKRI